MRATRTYRTGLHLTGLAGLVLLAFILASGAAAADQLSLHISGGQLRGVAVDGEALPASGVGGFYVQTYRARPGRNLLRESGFDQLPTPLPDGFAFDENVTWNGRPSLTINLPEDQLTDSGELNLHVDHIVPHHVYLLQFAHRGQRLGGELPPIMHLRQFDAEGNWATPQQNIELPGGTYPWQQETLAITAVEGAARLQIMIHHPLGTGQFWMSEMSLREVPAQQVAPVSGLWAPGASPTFSGVVPGTPITLQAAAEASGDTVSITTTLSAPSTWLQDHPTALILSFRLPLDAAGWRWGDYLRRERTIVRGEDYSYYHLIGRRQFREASAFPMAAVSGPDHGLALMVPMTPPLFTRLRYDGDGYLCAEFDLGLAARGRGDAETVTFSFDIVRSDPRWGWREALARYYQRYPRLFTSTARRGGWWIGPSENLPDLADFGLQYAELHFARADRTAANNNMGLYTCSYSEPWMWRVHVSDEGQPSLAQPLDSYLPQIEQDADLPASQMDDHDYWPAPRRDSVRAFLNAAIHGPNGSYQINSVRTYGGGTFIELNTSCLPGLRSERWGAMNRGLLSYRYETLEDIARCAAGGARMEGVYFDSVGNWSDIAAEDHRAEHFPYASFPLTFSYATGRPVISGLAAMAEYMQFIRQRGFVTMANSDPTYCRYAAPFLDMIGAGENYGDPFISDEALSHDRAVAFRRSVSFGNTGMLSASPEEAEARFRFLLFYQVYPGIFASDAAAVERLRPLYRRYVPVMREMSAAGWHPVPWATLDDPDLYLERYGPGTDHRVYFAIRNPTSQPRRCALTVEPLGFGEQPATLTEAVEVLSGQPLPIARPEGRLQLHVDVAAEDTALVRLSPRA